MPGAMAGAKRRRPDPGAWDRQAGGGVLELRDVALPVMAHFPRPTATRCAVPGSGRPGLAAKQRPSRPPIRCWPPTMTCDDIQRAVVCLVVAGEGPMTEQVRSSFRPLTVGEGDIDVSLRPRSLREFIGQPWVREQLQLVIEGANRGGTPDHILPSGPPGYKHVVKMITPPRAGVLAAGDVGAGATRRYLAAMLSNLVEHDCVVYRRDPPYRPARRGDAVSGDGRLPRRWWSPAVLNNRRFRWKSRRSPGRGDYPVGRVDRLRRPVYHRAQISTVAELERVLASPAGILVELGADAGAEIARRSRGTPRSPTGVVAPGA